MSVSEIRSICGCDILDFALKRNRAQSARFSSVDERTRRQLFRQEHPTEIMVSKCMDGRVHIATWTETPAGILTPKQNIGGKFDLGWPAFSASVREWLQYARTMRRQCLIIVTYHFSKGDFKRGCKGFNFDTNAARKNAFNLRDQIVRAFGNEAHAIVVGMETDDEALHLHGFGCDLFDTSGHTRMTRAELRYSLENMYSHLPSTVLGDLHRFVVGNQHHVLEIQSTNRTPVDLDHRECIIGVGQGFDWLHLPQVALVIGAYDHEWPSAVATAAKIVLDNIRGETAHSNQALLLISALCRESQGSIAWNCSSETVAYQRRYALESIRRHVPELEPHLSVLSGVVDAETRLLHVADQQKLQEAA